MDAHDAFQTSGNTSHCLGARGNLTHNTQTHTRRLLASRPVVIACHNAKRDPKIRSMRMDGVVDTLLTSHLSLSPSLILWRPLLSFSPFFFFPSSQNCCGAYHFFWITLRSLATLYHARTITVGLSIARMHTYTNGHQVEVAGRLLVMFSSPCHSTVRSATQPSIPCSDPGTEQAEGKTQQRTWNTNLPVQGLLG